MENAQVAAVFDEIADLLELRDENTFRIRSYRKAAQSIRDLAQRIETMAGKGADLLSIPGIGEATGAKILEILAKGTCERLEELRKEVPPGLPDLMRIPGVGPHKALKLNRLLGVTSVEDLRKACMEHRVRELPDMGARTEQLMLEGIAAMEGAGARISYQKAADRVASLSAHLGMVSDIARWEIAGSFRRGRETIGDLDVLVQAADRVKATDGILCYGGVSEVLGRGEERVSIRLRSGLRIDFRFVEPDAFGAAWIYFTGSKAHNIRTRRLAQDRGWKLNEYGLFAGDQRLAGTSEEEVYSRLGLAWIPPELREDQGEVEAAAEGRLPKLLERSDVRGDFQSHTNASDGRNTLEQMADAARRNGFEYLAITDHSRRTGGGLTDDGARRQADAIRDLNARLKGIRLLAGIEVDILKNGKLDMGRDALLDCDWVVAGVHYDRRMSREAMTGRVLKAVESGLIHCLAHPLGRLIDRRDPLELDLDRVIAACVENRVWIEINCRPERLDLPEPHCRRAREAGARFALSTDAHTTDGFRHMSLGVTLARRAWLTAGDILNTKSFRVLLKAIKRR